MDDLNQARIEWLTPGIKVRNRFTDEVRTATGKSMVDSGDVLFQVTWTVKRGEDRYGPDGVCSYSPGVMNMYRWELTDEWEIVL